AALRGAKASGRVTLENRRPHPLDGAARRFDAARQAIRPTVRSAVRVDLQAVHPVLASRDVGASVQFFRGLGFRVLFQDSPEMPKYAGVARDNVVLHLQWADPGQWAYPVDRPACRFMVRDVDA